MTDNLTTLQAKYEAQSALIGTLSRLKGFARAITEDQENSNDWTSVYDKATRIQSAIRNSQETLDLDILDQLGAITYS